jgi:hypothetical protein
VGGDAVREGKGRWRGRRRFLFNLGPCLRCGKCLMGRGERL